MMRVGMQGKIVLIYSLLILFAMQLSGVFLVRSLENYYLQNYASNQNAKGELLASFIRRYLLEEVGQEAYLAAMIAEFGGGAPPTETMILDRYGRLLAGPEQRSLSMLGGRVIQDDILLALAGNKIEAVRVDPDTGIRHHHLFMPVKNAGTVVGVIFMKGSLEHIYLTLREIKILLLTGWSIALGIAVLLGFLLTRTITRPIKEVTSRAAAMAGGDFSQLIAVRSGDEIGELGNMFNFLTGRLQQTLSEISAEKTKVEAILNYMTDGILAVNHQGKIVHLNPAARNILEGLGTRVGLGLPAYSILGPLFPRVELQSLLQSEKPVTRELRPGQAGEKTYQVYFAPFRESAEEQGMLIVMHDVTRERNYVRLQQEFVANVSHELRTPLTTVKNYVETLLNGAQEDPETRKRFLDVLEKETERMVKLVKDLLVLSQMDYQEMVWSREDVDLAAAVLDVLEQVEFEATARNLRLKTSLPPTPALVQGDADKIRQVMLILLDNSLKYSPPDGEITVSVCLHTDEVEVSVLDAGIGIPPGDVERVFERFYRVDKTRSRGSGGTGLGLSIARQIVEAHGGRIFLSSTLGQGTEVRLTLPRKVAASHASAGISENPQAGS